MNSTTATETAAFEERQSIFARKISFASAVFAAMAEANALDVQPFVTTMHGQLSHIARRAVEAALKDAPQGCLSEDDLQAMAYSIVDHAYDSDIPTATRYVIENHFTSALGLFREAQDGLREGWYSQDEYGNVRAAYLDALVLLNSTIGRVGK